VEWWYVCTRSGLIYWYIAIWYLFKTSYIGWLAFSEFRQFCFLSHKGLIIWFFNHFYFERTSWRLFQKFVVHTKLDIYVFISMSLITILYIMIALALRKTTLKRSCSEESRGYSSCHSIKAVLRMLGKKTILISLAYCTVIAILPIGLQSFKTGMCVQNNF
jgi:hypothetical protein